jgi:hypothetical protein
MTAMEIDSVEYRLSCVLRGHEDDVSPVFCLQISVLDLKFALSQLPEEHSLS